jgi:hypothetical protein
MKVIDDAEWGCWGGNPAPPPTSNSLEGSIVMAFDVMDGILNHQVEIVNHFDILRPSGYANAHQRRLAEVFRRN